METEEAVMLNYRQAASLTGLKISTLYSMVSRRQLPHYRLGRRLVAFSKTELSEWVRSRRVEISIEGQR